MTPQEAIEWLKTIEKKYIHGGDDDFDEKRKVAINNAVNAFEKQIPKKPKLKITGTTGWNTEYHCPNCNGFVTKGYCWHCGQALDWSDKNEVCSNT